MQAIEIENSPQLGLDDLLKVIQRFDNQSLSRFAYEVNLMVSKRNHLSLDQQEKALERQINTVIPASIKRQQKQLYKALQDNKITPKEHEELIFLNNILEEKAAERILLMGKLATLKGITIQQKQSKK